MMSSTSTATRSRAYDLSEEFRITLSAMDA